MNGIINFFRSNPELSKADIILAIECDNGMGRTDNKNVSKELWCGNHHVVCAF